MNITKKEISILLIAIASGVLIGTVAMSLISSETNQDETHKHSKKKEVWTCSMHPQIKLPKAGKCPICFMDLILLETGANMDNEDGLPQLTLSPYAQKLAQLQTSRVSTRPIAGMYELVGELSWDESLLSTQAAWFGGRVEKLMVSYTGQLIEKGAPIAEIYSPELYSAAAEWQQAQEAQDSLLMHSVKRKLKLLGIDKDQLKGLTSIKSERFIQRATSSGVVVALNLQEGQYIKSGQTIMRIGNINRLWVELELFENDLPHVKKGQEVTLRTESLPGKVFSGRVEFIHPILDPKTKTVTVRLSVKNNDTMLKPGMLVRAKLNFKTPRTALSIPETAPLLTGKRAVVYIETKPGSYIGREVQLGSLLNGYYEVIDGLSENDIIVTRGSFKIDAAMQIQALPSMMYPQGDGGSTQHNHSTGISKPIQPPTHQRSQAVTNALNIPESNIWLQKLFTQYLAVQNSLAEDNSNHSAKHLMHLAQTLHSVPIDLDDGKVHARAGVLQKVAEKKNIAEVRTQFLELSHWLIAVLKNSAFKPTQGAAIYFCPMANNNRGGKWLQAGGDVSNPYYGAAMLGCGEQLEKLSTPQKSTGGN